MSQVNPALREQFDSMPPQLQQAVLNTGMKLETLQDLMNCLECIIAEDDRP